MKKLLLFCLLLSAANLYAQQANSLKINVIPPSPNAASLGKYGDIPVGLHTGVPNISIPIYEVRNKDLSVPISISYHSSGIRVAETASWVGLGWALNAGGMITRTIQGTPDEGRNAGQTAFASTGYYNSTPAYNLPADIVLNSPDIMSQYNLFKQVGEGKVDAEPDIFSYSLNGYSGKFMFNESKIPVFFPEEDIKIAVNYNSGNGTANQRFISFVLTTPDGTKYYFGENNAKEYTASFTNYFTTYNGDYICSSWYLTKIESVNGDVITLEYQDEEYSFFDLAPEYYVLPVPNPSTICGGDAKKVTFTSVKGKKLWRVVSPHSIVEFHTNTKREDLAANTNYTNTETDLPADQASDALFPKAPKKLDRILIKDGTENNPATWKEFILQHGYFEAEIQEGNVAIFDKVKFKTDKKRLKLLSLTERNYISQYSKPPYLFEYEEKDNLGQMARLPRRISLAQDRQGYYNGRLGNLTLVDLPNVCANNNAPDRNPNFDYAKIGVLSSITYPTGGRTTFTYQLHREGETSTTGSGIATIGLRIFETRDNDGMTAIEKVKRYEYQQGTLFSKPTYQYNVYMQQFISGGQPFWKAGYPNINVSGQASPAFQIMSSNSVAPMQTTQGYHIGYSSVTVRNIGNNGNNGFTTYFYDRSYAPYPSGSEYIKIPSDPWYDGANSGYPEVQSQIYGGYPLRPPLHKYQRGNLLFEGQFSETGNLLSRATYEYETYTYTVRNMRATKVELINGTAEFLPYVHYPIFSGKSRLTKKTEVLYDQNQLTTTGGRGLTTTTEYIYRNDPVNTKVHLQPTKTTTTNSVGEQLITQMKYPLDYTFTGIPSENIALGIKNLQDKNIISPVIEKYTIRKNATSEKVLSGMITTFKNDQSLPEEIYLMKGDNTTNAVPPLLNTTTGTGTSSFKPSELVNNAFVMDDNYEARAKFHNYDAQGNLLEHSKTNDVRTTFIWGYNGTLPIAEVVNHGLINPITQTINIGGYYSNMQIITYAPTSIIVPQFTSNIMLKASITSSVLLETVTSIRIVMKNIQGIIVFSKDIFSPIPSQIFNDVLPLPQGSYQIGIQVYGSDSNVRVSISFDVGITSYSQNIFHTSFEENGVVSGDSKTGRRRYNLSSGAYSLPTMLPVANLPAESGTKYVLSFWYKTNATDAKWELFEGQYTTNLPTSISSNFVSGKTISAIDEVRIFPANAMMTTMTYDPLVGKTSVTDPNNVSTYFVYDGLQRLQYIKDQDGNIIQKTEYQYKKQN